MTERDYWLETRHKRLERERRQDRYLWDAQTGAAGDGLAMAIIVLALTVLALGAAL